MPGVMHEAAATQSSRSSAAGTAERAACDLIVFAFLACLEYGDAFDLDLGAVFEETFDFDERHRGVVSAHERAPALADLGGARGVLALVGHVDDETRDPARRAARFEYD